MVSCVSATLAMRGQAAPVMHLWELGSDPLPTSGLRQKDSRSRESVCREGSRVPVLPTVPLPLAGSPKWHEFSQCSAEPRGWSWLALTTVARGSRAVNQTSGCSTRGDSDQVIHGLGPGV